MEKRIYMCNNCDINSNECCIYINPLSNDYYLDIEISERDGYDYGYIHHREYIKGDKYELSKRR